MPPDGPSRQRPRGDQRSRPVSDGRAGERPGGREEGRERERDPAGAGGGVRYRRGGRSVATEHRDRDRAGGGVGGCPLSGPSVLPSRVPATTAEGTVSRGNGGGSPARIASASSRPGSTFPAVPFQPCTSPRGAPRSPRPSGGGGPRGSRPNPGMGRDRLPVRRQEPFP